MVDLAGITSGASAGASSSNRSAAQLADSFDDFLTLLTTQLQHQDPTDPMDSNQFTEQLVQFSSVEQQIKTNQNLETLTSLTLMNQRNNLATYLGKEALVPGLIGELNSASPETPGTINWRYNVPNEVSQTTLEVYNKDGNLVYSEPGEKVGGTFDFTWNGRDNFDNLVDNGAYSLKVSAVDEDGAPVDVGIAVRGKVNSIDLTGSEPIFDVDGNLIYQSEIVQLYET